MLSFSLLSGLGADLPTRFQINPEVLNTTLQPATTVQPTPGSCSADGLYIWIGATSTTPAHWERLRVGQACTTFDPSAGPTSRDHRGEDGVPQGGVSVSPTKVMSVGAFTIPVVRPGQQYIWGLDDYAKLKPDQAAQIRSQITVKVADGPSYWGAFDGIDCCEPGTTGTQWWKSGGQIAQGVTAQWPAAAPWGLWLTQTGWLRKIGLLTGENYDSAYTGTWEFNRTKAPPIAQFKHPENGAHYGMWMRLKPVGPQIKPLTAVRVNPDGTPTADQAGTNTYYTQSYQLQFMVAPMPEGGFFLWEWIKGAVKWVASNFYEAVWDAAEAISDALCAMTPAQIAAATAAGGPAAAAGAGAAQLLLDGKCPIPNPTPDGDPGKPGAVSPTPWGLIIAGGVAVFGVVAFILAQPKKRPA